MSAFGSVTASSDRLCLLKGSLSRRPDQALSLLKIKLLILLLALEYHLLFGIQVRLLPLYLNHHHQEPPVCLKLLA